MVRLQQCKKCGRAFGPRPDQIPGILRDALTATCPVCGGEVVELPDGEQPRMAYQQPQLDPQLAARMRRIVMAAAILLPLFFVLGFFVDAPQKPIHWVGRIGIAAFGLFPVSAIYLTIRSKFENPSLIAMFVALAGPIALAWVWILRWMN